MKAGKDAGTPPEERYFGRPCYVFNPRLKAELDDTGCSHCQFYLTTRCPHLGEFLERVDELEPLE